MRARFCGGKLLAGLPTSPSNTLTTMAARFSVVARKIFAHRYWWHLHNPWIYWAGCTAHARLHLFWPRDYLFVFRVFQAA